MRRATAQSADALELEPGVPSTGASAIRLEQFQRVPTPAPSLVPPRAPDHVRRSRRMIDAHGRTIRDLRVSLTDRCNFRCVYCMEPDVQFLPRPSLLTPAEIVRIVRVAESLGVRKVRLTGGEPTLHPQLVEIIAEIRAATSVEIAMITNGSRLTPDLLRRCKAAGLARITISIDTLRPDRFAQITRSASSPEQVLVGVRMAIDAGLTPIKLNAVLLRNVNDDEAVDMAMLARTLGVEVRFIEYMPLDSAHGWNPDKWVSASETRQAIERQFPLTPATDDDPASTARTFRFTDLPLGSPARIGFIAPVSNPFCGACSRLRVTADGRVRPCLFSTSEFDLRALLRDASNEQKVGGEALDQAIADFLIDATWTKQRGHGISAPGFVQPERPMSAIGG